MVGAGLPVLVLAEDPERQVVQTVRKANRWNVCVLQISPRPT